MKDKTTGSNYVNSNDDLNSSLKKEIENSNFSYPQGSSGSMSPNKGAHQRVEISRRAGSNDSDNRSSQNSNSVRRSQKFRGSSNGYSHERAIINEHIIKKKTLQQKCRKDSQESYIPGNDIVRLSQKEWDLRINNPTYSSQLDRADRNHMEMVMNNTPSSALNQTQNLKLCDYLKIMDPRGSGGSMPTSNKNSKKKSNPNDTNIIFESLSAIAKIFSDNAKRNEFSELDLEDEKYNDSNIEEVTEEDVSDIFDKRKSHPETININRADLQSNALLVNALRGASHKTVYPENKAVCNSVIIENESKAKSKRKGKHFKKPGLNTLQRKFTVKNKRESDSLLVYNDDYKDYAPKNKRQTMAGKARAGGTRRSRKDHKFEDRLSSRKTLKVPSIPKQSHKRSQSFNKSTLEHKYRSVPYNGNQYEHEKSNKMNAKKKLN